MSPRRHKIHLQQRLASRLLPLVFLTILTLTISAPTAYLLLRFRSLTQQGNSFAVQIATFIKREAQLEPVMWRYDAQKLLSHLRSYRAPKQLECIKILDTQQRSVVTSCTHTRSKAQKRHSLWSVAPIHIGQHKQGQVWVSMSSKQARSYTFLLLCLFALVSAALGWLLYNLPLRAIAQAEEALRQVFSRLRHTQEELQTLNQSLEKEVEKRTQELHQKERRLRELSTQAMVLQEEERRAISRELHDAVGQSLTGLRLQLQLLSHQPNLPAEAERMLEQTLQLTDHSIDEVRRAVQRLGPAIVHEVGLLEALARLCTTFSEQMPLELTQELEPCPPLPLSVENAIYRIAQEALNNIARHTNASHVTLRLRCKANTLILDIEDNGPGFKPEEESRNGRGLLGIQERCELLGGTMVLQSAPTQGTHLHITLPLK